MIPTLWHPLDSKDFYPYGKWVKSTRFPGFSSQTDSQDHLVKQIPKILKLREGFSPQELVSVRPPGGEVGDHNARQGAAGLSRQRGETETNTHANEHPPPRSPPTALTAGSFSSPVNLIHLRSLDAHHFQKQTWTTPKRTPPFPM